VPGGFFFLGHAETLRGVTQDFHLCHAGDAFYYQRKEGPLRSWSPPPGSETAAVASPDRLELPAPNDRWFDTITQSADRVNALHAVSPPRAGAVSTDRKTIRTSQLLPLIETERFAEALTLLQNAAPSDDADQALLQAVVAAQAGRFDTARGLCDSILQRDELNAGAQYVLALCYEHAGDADRAIYHDQLSAYLDPGFAMPRVHLGLLHKRRGDVSAAGRELREARKLIEREDASRLLLFGGGFGRAALLALCDAELAKGTRERQ
jgi:chemotaxis protein methyltransferase CheR